jgi:cysteine desulfurase
MDTQLLDISKINQSLKGLYALLGAGKEDRFFFASSGAEAEREIYFSHYIDFIRQTGRNHFLTFPIVAPTTQASLKRLEIFGCSHKTVSLNLQGQLSKNAVEETLRARSSLLSVPWADSLTGVIQPIEEIADVCKRQGVRLHVDATAALGKLFFRFQDLGADYLSFDGMQEGTGGFLVKGEIPVEAPLTLNATGLNQLTDSLDQLMHFFDYYSTETVRLRDKLEKGIQESCNEARFLFSSVERLPNYSLIAFPGIASESLLYFLQRKGIGAFNGNGRLALHLIACGLEPELAHSAICFTLSHKITEEEIDRMIEQITIFVKKLRNLSKQLL